MCFRVSKSAEAFARPPLGYQSAGMDSKSMLNVVHSILFVCGGLAGFFICKALPLLSTRSEKVRRSKSSETAWDSEIVDGSRILVASADQLKIALERLRQNLSLLESQIDRQQSECLDNDTRDLEHFIDELVALSKLNLRGNSELSQPVDLVEIAGDESDRFGDVDFDSDTLEFVIGDINLLRKLIRCLLEHTAEWGASPAQVMVRSQDQRVLLEISHAHRGMRQDEFDQITDLAPSRSPEERGQQDAIRLLTVNWIAQVHSAEISFQSHHSPQIIVSFAAYDDPIELIDNYSW